jgi:hypothetical protein
MNDLERFCYTKSRESLLKWTHYLEVYDRHFARFRSKAPVVVEIGVYQGGSLQMWRDYFGPDAKIIGVDINPECLALKQQGFEIEIGDQGNPIFWLDFKAKYPQVDILIDDGGHLTKQQWVTFEHMFPHISETGVYLCEDTHASYHPAYISYAGENPQRRDPGTFMEFTKKLVDEMNAWWWLPDNAMPTPFTRSCASMHYYPMVVVFEKLPRSRPRDFMAENGKVYYDVAIPPHWGVPRSEEGLVHLQKIRSVGPLATKPEK